MSPKRRSKILKMKKGEANKPLPTNPGATLFLLNLFPQRL